MQYHILMYGKSQHLIECTCILSCVTWCAHYSKTSVPRSNRCPFISVALRTPGLYGHLTNTRSERTSASVSLKLSKYFIKACVETVTEADCGYELCWQGVLSPLQYICKNSSILYVCNAILRRWVVSYFLSNLSIFNVNTYNKLSPKGSYYINPLKKRLRYKTVASVTLSGSHLQVFTIY